LSAFNRICHKPTVLLLLLLLVVVVVG